MHNTRSFLKSLVALPALAFVPSPTSKKKVQPRDTGLKDKHNRPILEGDIVLHDNLGHSYAFGKSQVELFYVSFVLHQNSTVYCLTRKNDGPIFNIWEGKHIVVVGNMTETPERLVQKIHIPSPNPYDMNYNT